MIQVTEQVQMLSSSVFQKGASDASLIMIGLQICCTLHDSTLAPLGQDSVAPPCHESITSADAPLILLQSRFNSGTSKKCSDSATSEVDSWMDTER